MSEYKTDLISYYPEFLQENLEFNAICDASNPEFDLVWKRLKQIEENILPQSADSDGIEQYENWLGIVSNPYLDLETRRAQVISKLNETLPYTEIRLQRMLAAIVGWGHFTYTREGAFVKVELDDESVPQSPVVYDLLKRVLPLNLHFELNCNFNTEEQELVFAIGTMVTETVVTPIDLTEHIAHLYNTGTTQVKHIITTEINHDNETSSVYIGVAGRTVETIITEIDES